VRPSRLALWLLILLIASAAGTSYLLSPAFFPSRIEVTGNSVVAAETIRDLAGIPLDRSIWQLDLGAAARRVEHHPLIRTAVVERRWDGTVLITVEERTPFAALPYFDAFLLVDLTGAVLEIRQAFPTGFPLVTGVDLPAVAVGQLLDSGPLQWALDTLFYLTEAGRGAVSEVHVGPDLEITLYTVDGARVLLGRADARLSRKLQFLEGILWELQEKGEAAEYIDLRYPDHPVIKPRPAPRKDPG